MYSTHSRTTMEVVEIIRKTSRLAMCLYIMHATIDECVSRSIRHDQALLILVPRVQLLMAAEEDRKSVV